MAIGIIGFNGALWSAHDRACRGNSVWPAWGCWCPTITPYGPGAKGALGFNGNSPGPLINNNKKIRRPLIVKRRRLRVRPFSPLSTATFSLLNLSLESLTF